MSIENRKQVMVDLIKEKEELQQQLSETEAAIKGLRRICRHKYADGTSALKFSHRDHNYIYHVCEICQTETQE